MKKIWRYQIDENKKLEINKLSRSLNISFSLCEILYNRGIKNFDEAKKLFRPSSSDMHDPFLMKDMKKTANKIISCLKEDKKILLYGDYDVDGTTSITLMLIFFKTVFPHCPVLYHIPNRLKDGYGLNNNGVEFILKESPNLVITLDCGIKSKAEIDLLNNHNIEVIICDHHLPDENNLPAAYSIINPKQKSCHYPFKDLCACGITYKLIQALITESKFSDRLLEQIIEFTGLATSADIVPLIDENRFFVIEAIKKINTNPTTSLKALIKTSGLPEIITNTQFVFGITPRINAMGRIDDPQRIVNFFLEPNYEVAVKKAEEINYTNIERQKIDKNISVDVKTRIDQYEILENKFSIVEYDASWHKGVLGIIAARMVENYFKPCVILTKSDNDKLVGSVRGIDGVNIIEVLDSCSTYLETYGGHYFAAGLSLKEDNLKNFTIQFEKSIRENFNNQIPTPNILIDSLISLDRINLKFCNILKQMEPHGPLNTRPIFLTKNVEIPSIEILKNKHLRLGIKQSYFFIKAFFFNALDKIDFIRGKLFHDIVYKIEIQTWNNEERVQLKIIDIQ